MLKIINATLKIKSKAIGPKAKVIKCGLESKA